MSRPGALRTSARVGAIPVLGHRGFGTSLQTPQCVPPAWAQATPPDFTLNPLLILPHLTRGEGIIQQRRDLDRTVCAWAWPVGSVRPALASNSAKATNSPLVPPGPGMTASTSPDATGRCVPQRARRVARAVPSMSRADWRRSGTAIHGGRCRPSPVSECTAGQLYACSQFFDHERIISGPGASGSRLRRN